MNLIKTILFFYSSQTQVNELKILKMVLYGL